MNNDLDIAVIILTYNEELHIRRCLENARQVSDEIFVIDCFSTDKTVEIARELGAKILQNPWHNSYADQFNWALDNAPITKTWILRLDADEYLLPETIAELRIKLPQLPESVNGISLPLRRIFLGKHIKSNDGITALRIFRRGFGNCEKRCMDEHIQISGEMIHFKHGFADDNLNDLSWWANKHIKYAIREAADLLNLEFDLSNTGSDDSQKSLEKQAQRKRQKKQRYAKLPLFWRSFAYFLYRYFLKRGFLDGKEGFLWHFLQGWWYRTFVDAKVYELKKASGNDPVKMKQILFEKYHIQL